MTFAPAPAAFIAPGDPSLRLDRVLPLFLGDEPQHWADKRVLLILIDGLGWWNLQEYLGHAANLRGWCRRGEAGEVGSGQGFSSRFEAVPGEVAGDGLEAGAVRVGVGHSVLPSTTAAAITSILTGEAPGKHNMLSYELFDPRLDAQFNLINFCGYPENISDFQPHPTFFEKLGKAGLQSHALGPKKFIAGGLTQAALRGATYVSSERLESRARDAARLSRQSPLTYFYVADVDHAGHSYGVGSEKWLTALELTDRAVGICLDALEPGVEVILTADHGMLNTDPAHTLDLAKSCAANLVTGIAGEGRALHLRGNTSALHLRQALREALRDAGQRVHEGSVAQALEALPESQCGTLVLTREETAELLAAYNGTAVRRAELLGEVNIFSAGRNQVLDSRFHKPQVFKMIGLHGGLSEIEMRVPLLYYRS